MNQTFTIDVNLSDLEETSTTSEKRGVWHYYDIPINKTFRMNDRLIFNLDGDMIASVTIDELIDEGSGYGESQNVVVELPPGSKGDAWKKLKNGIRINYVQLDIFRKYK